MQPKTDQKQTKKLTERLKMKKPVIISSIEAAKAALPIFGGTTPVATPPPAGESSTPTSESTPAPSGGESKPDDPIEKLAKDPNALGQLLTQVDRLQKDLTKITTERDQYAQKQAEEERKTQSREQQLENDVNSRDQIIAQMDAVIKNMAVTNAMLSQKNVQWHDVSMAIASLRPDEFDIDVDLDNGSATVTGIENAAKRIANEKPFLVKSAGEPITSGPPKPKGSGAPPAPPTNDAQKAQRREALMKRFPVIAHGR